MSLIGLDINASRARAVAGPRSQALSLLCLEGDQVELPLAISLQEKQPRVGRAGLGLVRLRPHLACLDFLPHLGTAHTWSAGPHRLDADAAFALVLDALMRPLYRATGVVLALPGYLDPFQLALVHSQIEASRVRMTAWLPAPLAAALAAHETESGIDASPGLLLVIDVDGYALTWSIVERESGHLRRRLSQAAPHLGRAQWLRKLLDGVAQRCVRQSRRDPRESAETEQALYEQLVLALDGESQRGPLVQLRIQGQQWYHHLMLAPEDLVAFVSPLLRQALSELDTILGTVEAMGGLESAVVTASAAGLPGLVPALQSRLETMRRASPVDETADYGDLLMSALNRRDPVRILAADAIASAAHEVAVRVHRGDIQPGHLESLPLSAGAGNLALDPGPARLNFRGQDHILSAAPFTLGRDPTCDLVFESELYPHVSARHCEIVYDRRAYTLCDRSRHGTLLNDRRIEQQVALHSGDWIRLGPHGPVLRFLGQNTGLAR
jgi:hypothetical protein